MSQAGQRGEQLLLEPWRSVLQLAQPASLSSSAAQLVSFSGRQEPAAMGSIVLRHPLLSASVLESSEGTARQGALDGDEKFVTQ